jgi:hypothetical protein
MTTIHSGALTQQVQQKPLGQLGAASASKTADQARSASDFAKIFEALNSEADGKISPAETTPAAAPTQSSGVQSPWETVRAAETTTSQSRTPAASRGQAPAEPSLMDMTQTLSTRLMAQILGNMDALPA